MSWRRGIGCIFVEILLVSTTFIYRVLTDTPEKQAAGDAQDVAARKRARVERIVEGHLRYPDSATFKHGAKLGCGWVNAKNAVREYEGYRRFVAAGEKVSIEGAVNEAREFDSLWREHS